MSRFLDDGDIIAENALLHLESLESIIIDLNKTQENNGWIRVEDKLPSRNGEDRSVDCLMLYDKGIVSGYFYIFDFVVGSGFSYPTNTKINATHWMPIHELLHKG